MEANPLVGDRRGELDADAPAVAAGAGEGKGDGALEARVPADAECWLAYLNEVSKAVIALRYGCSNSSSSVNGVTATVAGMEGERGYCFSKFVAE